MTREFESKLARSSHYRSTATTRTLHDFHSVRALNIVSTMLTHSSVAKDMQGTTFRRLATNGGENCGLAVVGNCGIGTAIALIFAEAGAKVVVAS